MKSAQCTRTNSPPHRRLRKGVIKDSPITPYSPPHRRLRKFNRDAIRFELVNSQQYKKPAIITLANFVNKLPVNERIARFQTLAQSEIIHPSHIASAPVVDDTPKLSREEKLARIAQIERGEI